MVAILLYVLILILSIVLIVVDIVRAILDGNITHLENNREPNAGVSIIFYIFFPVFFIGLAYIGNAWLYGLGWCMSFGLLALNLLCLAVYVPRKMTKYKALLKHSCSN